VNGQVTPEGVVKVLDLGLAKPAGSETASGAIDDEAATITEANR
jgi:hypothetical protein